MIPALVEVTVDIVSCLVHEEDCGRCMDFSEQALRLMYAMALTRCANLWCTHIVHLMSSQHLQLVVHCEQNIMLPTSLVNHIFYELVISPVTGRNLRGYWSNSHVICRVYGQALIDFDLRHIHLYSRKLV